MVVRFHDLDPGQPAEARELLQRVRSSAKSMCRRNDGIRDLNAQRDREACMREGYADAVAYINRMHGVDLEAVASRAPAIPELAITRE